MDRLDPTGAIVLSSKHQVYKPGEPLSAEAAKILVLKSTTGLLVLVLIELLPIRLDLLPAEAAEVQMRPCMGVCCTLACPRVAACSHAHMCAAEAYGAQEGLFYGHAAGQPFVFGNDA